MSEAADLPVRTAIFQARPRPRPRDRKAQIIAAAADLFRQHGFHRVTLADVADAVGISAPAIYRHVRNKQELLLAAVRDGLDSLEEAVRAAANIYELVTALVDFSMQHTGLAALWQREARHLPDAERAQARSRLTGLVRQITAFIGDERRELSEADAELLAWSLLGVLAGAATREPAIRQPRREELAYAIAHAVPQCTLRTESTGAVVERGHHQANLDTRREQLLNAAIELFDRRGYGSVSMNDIGAAVGMAGPSVYKHFGAKTDLLVAAMVRGNERLHAGIPLIHETIDPQESLQILLRSHIEFSVRNSHLIGLLISERDQLPEHERAATYRLQDDYLRVWVRVVAQAIPGHDPRELALRVNAVFTVINNLVRTGNAHRRADLSTRLTELAIAILVAGT
ncbi:TetR/AcrR family transcriptional regulator [Cumulibacter soli]|uniref:TetR/AcrR family transcriptional regulator n=1 Tax=Cumulibacter soli TaxID=2546344 RepID=UPI001067A552|nr:TetR/AcrR family transcriptional regulator [Cumulibacter soli]